MTTCGQDPAFPNPEMGVRDFGDVAAYPGLTKRELLAGLAMTGLLADHKDHADECRVISPPDYGPEVRETCPQAVARLAVEHADALIEALKK